MTTDVGLPPHFELRDWYNELHQTPSDINEHLPYLRQLAADADTVLELGTRHAVSTVALLLGLANRFRRGTPMLVCVDLERKPEVDRIERLADSAEIGVDFYFLETTSLRPLDWYRVHQHTGPVTPVPVWNMLFIDTWHVAAQLRQELDIHAPYVRPGGCMVFHDTTTFWDRPETEGHDGLGPAIEEFMENHPEWVLERRVAFCNGLLTLRRKRV